MSLEQMENDSVATALISIVQPGTLFGNNEEARALARHCNEYGTQMAKDHPGRFGLFAALPLPDVEESCHSSEKPARQEYQRRLTSGAAVASLDFANSRMRA